MTTPRCSQPDVVDSRAWVEQVLAPYGIQPEEAANLGLELVLPDEAARRLHTEQAIPSAGLWIAYPRVCGYGQLLLQKPLPQIMRNGCVRLVEYIAPWQLPKHAFIPLGLQANQSANPDEPIILIVGELAALSFMRGGLANIIGLQAPDGWWDEQQQVLVPELNEVMTPGRRFVWLFPVHATWREDYRQGLERFDQECRERGCVLQIGQLPNS